MNFAKTFMTPGGVASEDLDVNTVLGRPETVGETILVPVTEMLVGFGVGANTDKECCEDETGACCDAEEGGTQVGGHAHARPIATIEVGPTETRVHPIVDSQRVTLAAVLLSGWVFGWVAVVLNELLNQKHS